MIELYFYFPLVYMKPLVKRKSNVLVALLHFLAVYGTLTSSYV